MTHCFHVSPSHAKLRLDEFLACRLPAFSRMYLARRIAAGHCQVDGIRREAGFRLRGGEQVVIAVEPQVTGAMTLSPIPLAILYEDDHLLVVDKPAGMLVHPNKCERTGTLVNALAWHCNPGWRDDSLHSPAEPVIRPGLVHRLDRETSGLMVVAKTPLALSRLGRAFAARRVSKKYVAVVAGVCSPKEMLIQAPIGRDPSRRPPWGILSTGKHAETRGRVLASGRDRTLLELVPITGRTNQLRIHCAWAGFPILGDHLYGGPPADRLYLHAVALSFPHPLAQAALEFSTPLPPLFRAALNSGPTP